MTYLIAGILISINSIFAFLKNNGKVLAFLLLSFIWILFWANISNPDYFGYLYSYSGIQSGAPVFDTRNSEFGYRLLMKIGVLLGLDFKTFIAIITAFSYLLIHNTVKKYCSNYSYVYVLYFVFPFFLDVVQVRNFIAMALFIFAVKYLLDNSKISKIKYVAIILLAASIHYASLLYLPMILINTEKKNNLVRGIVIFSVLSCFIILINNKQIPFIGQLIAYFYHGDYVLRWFDSKTNWGFVLFWCIQIYSFIMMWYTKSTLAKITVRKTKSHLNANSIDIKFVNLIYWINIMAFIYFPFYLLESTFTRLMRNILLLNYISFAITHKNISKKRKLIFNSLVVIYVLFLFIVQLYIPHKESVIDAVLQNNFLFN